MAAIMVTYAPYALAFVAISAAFLIVARYVFPVLANGLERLQPRPKNAGLGIALIPAITLLSTVISALRGVADVSESVLGRTADIAGSIRSLIPEFIAALDKPLIAAVVFGASGAFFGYWSGAVSMKETLAQSRSATAELKVHTRKVEDALAVAQREIDRLKKFEPKGKPSGKR